MPFMSRVTSLTSMPEAQLNRWIKRIGLLLIVGIVAFVAFYAIDRFRAPATPIVDQRARRARGGGPRRTPPDIASRGQLADLYFAKGRFDDAIAQYTEILIDAARRTSSWLRRPGAAPCELKGDLRPPRPTTTRSSRSASPGEMANVDPNLESAYYGLGIDRPASRTSPTRRSTQLLKALAIKRTDADALNALGAAYVKAGTAGQGRRAAAQGDRARAGRLGRSVPDAGRRPTRRAGEPDAGRVGRARWPPASTGDAAGAVKRLHGASSDGKAGLEARVGLGLLAETQRRRRHRGQWYRKALAARPQEPGRPSSG